MAAESVTHWAPPRISSPLFESHAAFDPLTGDLLFVRSSKEFRGWRILASHCGPRGWTEPRPAAFAAPGLEADPFFTAAVVIDLRAETPAWRPAISKAIGLEVTTGRKIGHLRAREIQRVKRTAVQLTRVFIESPGQESD